MMPIRKTAWVAPTVDTLGRAEISLRYEFALPRNDGSTAKAGPRLVPVPIIWPAGATRHDAKVRVWSEPGTNPALADLHGAGESWNDYGVELVAEVDVLPALVLRHTGSNAPLTLRLTKTTGPALASLFCERGLIQVAIDEEGNHAYRGSLLGAKAQCPPA